MNRLTGETYPDAAVSRSDDANDHLVQVSDSQSGVFNFTYDGVGRMLKSVGPFGAVAMTYDKVGRVLTRQVTGQPGETLHL